MAAKLRPFYCIDCTINETYTHYVTFGAKLTFVRLFTQWRIPDCELGGGGGGGGGGGVLSRYKRGWVREGALPPPAPARGYGGA